MEKYLKYKERYVKRIIGGAVEEAAAPRTPMTSVIKRKDDVSFQERYNVGDNVYVATNGGPVIGRVMSKENLAENFIYRIALLTKLLNTPYAVITDPEGLNLEQFTFIDYLPRGPDTFITEYGFNAQYTGYLPDRLK